jgi:hypothetical protein
MKTALQFIGFACFILIVVVSISYAGFAEKGHHTPNEREVITDKTTLYAVGAILGLLGSLLLSHKMWKAAMPAGLASGLTLVAFTLFYLSFRETFWNYEMLLILFVGTIPYIMIFGFLSEKIYGVEAFPVEKKSENAD